MWRAGAKSRASIIARSSSGVSRLFPFWAIPLIPTPFQYDAVVEFSDFVASFGCRIPEARRANSAQ
jgi:hypothetical protein